MLGQCGEDMGKNTEYLLHIAKQIKFHTRKETDIVVEQPAYFNQLRKPLYPFNAPANRPRINNLPNAR